VRFQRVVGDVAADVEQAARKFIPKVGVKRLVFQELRHALAHLLGRQLEAEHRGAGDDEAGGGDLLSGRLGGRERPRALPDRYVDMNLLSSDSVSEADAAKALDERAVLAGLPPLIKGYLRLGGFIGDGAVIDEQFNTIDVCIIVVTDQLTDKYFNHYQRKLGEG